MMSKNQLIHILFILFIINSSFAQIDVFEDEVLHKNKLVYYQNIPLTGTLYSIDEIDINNACQCVLKETYKNGKLNGLKQEWYTTGNRKYEGYFIDGKKNENHIFWSKDGKPNLKEKYSNGRLIEREKYYLSGNLKSLTKYSLINDNEKIYEKKLYENGTVLTEINYKNNLKDGFFIENFANGNPNKKIKYSKDIIVEKYLYNQEGKLIESLEQVKNRKLFISTKMFDNQQIKEKGYYTKDYKKDSIWITFNEQGEKQIENKYISGRLVGEGKYKNNKKDGLWKLFINNGKTQKNTWYEKGIISREKTFNIDHLYSNNYTDSDDVLLLEYKDANGKKENITLTSDVPFTKDRQNQYILGAIANSFLTKMKVITKESINESTTIDKKIHISNIKIRYTTANVYGNITKEYFTTYNAFISFDLKMKNIDGKLLFSKSYEFNRSNKILNSILNAAVQTYAKTKNDAFFSALKSIKFKSLFKKYFNSKK